jgi:acyl CoA:acetate/3-ketoacid CoA transferase
LRGDICYLGGSSASIRGNDIFQKLICPASFILVAFNSCPVQYHLIRLHHHLPRNSPVRLHNGIRSLSQLNLTAPLTKSKQITKMILSYVGTNKNLQDAYLSGKIELELSPQGTIAERLRSAAAGLPGFYTRTGAGELRSWLFF